MGKEEEKEEMEGRADRREGEGKAGGGGGIADETATPPVTQRDPL